MIDRGRHNVLGVMVNALDYDAAVARIVAAGRARNPLAVSALAVHGVMTGVLDQLKALDRSLVHGRGEHRVPASTRRLRLIHGDVGISEALLWRLVPGRAHGDTDTGADEDLMPVRLQRRLELSMDTFGDAAGTSGLLARLQEHGELVAAQSSQRVSGAERRG